MAERCAVVGIGMTKMAKCRDDLSMAGLVREALGLGDGVAVNPSGGALCGNPMFAAGLARIGLAAGEIMAGRADRALGHATSGAALQQNLVCVMEARA